MRNSDGRDAHRSIRWQQPAVNFLLVLLGAFCFVKYLGWAWVFSGNYGLPSHAGLVLTARQQSLTYFWIGLFVEVALIANLTLNIRLNHTELSGLPKAVGRGLIALAIAVIGTLGVAFLLSWIGEKARL